ncbi:MAG TPA: rubredoxin [Burkholderiales bacterium]
MGAPCGYVYDEALGLPKAGIAPGTPFEALPDDWQSRTTA